MWAVALVWAAAAVAQGDSSEVEGSGESDRAAETDGSGIASAEAGVEPQKLEGESEGTGARPTVPSADERPPVAPLSEPPTRVVLIDIDEEITPGIASFVQRALAEADASDVVVLRIDTFGGRVDAAVEIRDAVLASESHTVAFIENRAISAGALIAYAADTIVFSNAASMGAATPIQVDGGQAVAVGEKVVSYMRAEIRATADANGRRTDIAEAMVDRTVMVEGVVDNETLLTVTTGEAVALEIADGVADSFEDLRVDLGAGESPVHIAERNWGEELAMFLTSPAVSSVLMSLGLLGLWIEIKAPGFGVFGAIGLSCLFAFFFGHFAVDLAGWEEVILLGIGLVLLIAEIFVIPGFGVAGIAGILAIVGALTMAMINVPLQVALDLGVLSSIVWRVIAAILLALAGTATILRFLPTRALPGWLVLHTAIEDQSGAGNSDDVTEETLLGAVGFASTDLRPSGKAQFEGHIVDVVSSMTFIERGSRVRVIEVAGVRVVVEPCPESTTTLISDPNHAES
ncbi:MAG: membrane-bound serine protease (ClpP class) [Bradymonadia bacterium]